MKKGDKVKIIAGRDRTLGPSTVLRVIPETNRVIVEGRNLVKKHKKGNPVTGSVSQIVETEAAIHASNVALWSDKAQAPVRTQMRWLGANDSVHTSEAAAAASFPTPPDRVRKVRYCVKTGETFA